MNDIIRALRIMDCLSSINFHMPHFRARLASAVSRTVC